MMLKEIDLQNYLFKTDVYELPPTTRLSIMDSLRREMIEIFSGRNVFLKEMLFERKENGLTGKYDRRNE